MVFSSNAFLFLFLPLFLTAYFLTPNRTRWRNCVILIGSYLFYAWWRPDYVLLFSLITIFNYLIGREIGGHGPRTKPARLWMRVGVTVDLLVLGYFKYTNFGVGAVNDLRAAFGAAPYLIDHVLLPIGISFYIFESISYINDVYRGSVPATKHPVDFATFIALFPHLIVGPLFRYKDISKQLEHRDHSIDLFGRGAVRVMQGFAKKVLIADSLAPLVNHGFLLPNPSTADVWLSVLSYGAQLYFDFSGYSDMAIGLGMMMGFRFIENFNRPFLSQSTTEFWHRWHISLSTWLRDYVFYALSGGGRLTRSRIYWMVFGTFLIGGVWHGANWTFICWGALQGLLLMFERMAGVTGYPSEFKWRRWIPSFGLSVLLSMVLFRAESIHRAIEMYGPMLLLKNRGGISDPMASVMDSVQLTALAAAYGLIFVEGLQEYGPKLSFGSERFRRISAVIVLVPLFLLAISKLSADGYSAFLYFQF